MRHKKTYSIGAIIIVVGACLVYFWHHQRVEDNLKGICVKEGRVLSREELYQRAMLSYWKTKINSIKKDNEEHDTRDTIFIPVGPITKEQFIQKIHEDQRKIKYGTYNTIHIEKFIKLQPLLVEEQLRGRLLHDPKNIFVLGATKGDGLEIYVHYDNCCTVVSEDEARENGAIIRKKRWDAHIWENSEFDPENAKKKGYGLYYLKVINHTIKSHEDGLSEEETGHAYCPISNCGDVYEHSYIYEDQGGKGFKAIGIVSFGMQ